MKPLSPRHEVFAQARARGETADAAYVAAGYKRHDGNAARLSGNERILRRVQELQQASVTETMLTIREKREFFARLVRARLSELPDDSDLWQEFRTTVDGATRKLLDKLRAISLDNELDPEARNLAPKDDGVTVVVRIGGPDDGNG